MEKFRNYAIKGKRLTSAFMLGFRVNGEILETEGLQTESPQTGRRIIFFEEIDGMETDLKWGRFQSGIHISGEMSYCIHFFAANENEMIYQEKRQKISRILRDETISLKEKKRLFELSEEQVFVNQQEVLLYELSGRYLWFYIELFGEGQASIKSMCLRLPGDNFMDTYPHIYQEWGGFFHRYLSVLSTVYNDLHMEIKQVGELFGADTAPPALLVILLSWLGIDVSGNFIEEEALRTLLREGYQLNKRKGTGYGIGRVAEILLGEQVILVEQGFTLTLLVRTYLDEKKRSQLLFLLNQFLPVRCSLCVVYLGKQNMLNTHCYLDINAGIYNKETAVLDCHKALNMHLMLT